MAQQVTSASPYVWPYDGALTADDTALVLIDMQVDFCGLGGYVAQMGYDVSLTRAPIEPLRKVLAAARSAGIRVIHTREGHRPSLADLPKNKKWRSEQLGAGIGSHGPCGRILTRGEPGWELIPELSPLPHEDIIDKPGKGSFCATDLDLVLRTMGIRRLILGGITTDVCVHTTMREANDLGYECLLIEDGTGATDLGNHNSAIKMVHMQGGVFGATAHTDAIVKALNSLPRPATPLTPSPTHGAGMVTSANPSSFAWPAGGLALVMVDWQRDFVDPGGFGEALGNDVTPLRAAMPAAVAVLNAARKAGIPVVHTLEAHRPDLSDCPPSKKARCPCIGEILPGYEKNGRVLIAGEPGNGLCEEVKAMEGELVMRKPGKGAFSCGTNLEAHLRALGTTHIIFTGVTTEVCVQTSMREANDRGFNCLLVEDATASYFPEFKASILAMLVSQGGIVGWTASSQDVVAAMKQSA